jgi:uncharacterized protein (TIGR03437 family)
VPVLRRLFRLVAQVCFWNALSIGQVNVLTSNYDTQRTNANRKETTLTPATVGPRTFGRVGSLPVDSQVCAQPLYVSGVQIPGVGAKNVVYVATMNNSVYAWDADSPGVATPIWQVNLGTPVQTSSLSFSDISPSVGILSTPVIDATAQVLYAVAEVSQNGLPQFQLHALSLLDGREMLSGPATIGASLSSASGAVVTFDPFWHLQRPGLALANGAVYIAFGAHADAGTYHGWLLAYDASNLQRQIAVFNTTPNGQAGGIWQSGRAPAIDGTGNVYIVSGNGDFNGTTNLSGAVIKLSGATLSVLDWFTPANWSYDDSNDLDVGSTGGILDPNSSLLIAGDKAGYIYRLDTNSLGNIETFQGMVDFQATAQSIFELAVWARRDGTIIFQHDWFGPLKAYELNHGIITEAPIATSDWSGDSVYSGMAVSSNGSAGGIVWETTGDHSRQGVPGTLHAFDAIDLAELWNSDWQADRDSLGAFAKFAVPLVANGRIYVPTFSNQIAVYGLISITGLPSTAPAISAIINGASLLQAPISPGEVLAISGVNLGPADGASMQVDANGRVSSNLGGTQVFFDGIAAPLLYTSHSQVYTVVPLAVTGPTTQLIVQHNGEASPEIATPVSVASPGLFALSAAGAGQLLSVNEDGNLNSAETPCGAGSVITLFATGLGLIDPTIEDGVIVSSDLAVKSPAVSVWIDGLRADVLTVSAPSGMVGGVFQISARVPESASRGTAVSIFLEVSDIASANGNTIAIE